MMREINYFDKVVFSLHRNLVIIRTADRPTTFLVPITEYFFYYKFKVETSNMISNVVSFVEYFADFCYWKSER